mmetsp:Transcript_5084/g.19647  ORF Transcript_5084/g.19647 Transcript_5084/m.19647 type:complete len:364 (-) Transcript_5084:5404-6495(-)
MTFVHIRVGHSLTQTQLCTAGPVLRRGQRQTLEQLIAIFVNFVNFHADFSAHRHDNVTRRRPYEMDVVYSSRFIWAVARIIIRRNFQNVHNLGADVAVELETNIIHFFVVSFHWNNALQGVARAEVLHDARRLRLAVCIRVRRAITVRLHEFFHAAQERTRPKRDGIIHRGEVPSPCVLRRVVVVRQRCPGAYFFISNEHWCVTTVHWLEFKGCTCVRAIAFAMEQAQIYVNVRHIREEHVCCLAHKPHDGGYLFRVAPPCARGVSDGASAVANCMIFELRGNRVRLSNRKCGVKPSRFIGIVLERLRLRSNFIHKYLGSMQTARCRTHGFAFREHDSSSEWNGCMIFKVHRVHSEMQQFHRL